MKTSLVIALVLGIAGGIAHADAPRPARAPGPLRQALVARFDKNHDGRLEPRERRQAARVLRKLANRLEQRSRREAMVERYDLNGDGRVGPREVPPVVRDRLRRLDRNRDGWVEPNEMP